MKIAVLGVGAVGGVIGGFLTRAGYDVTLIDTWPANIERIKTDGLTVTTPEEEFTVHPTALHLGEVSASRPAFDTVVLAVKSYDTAWSTVFIEPYLAPRGVIVSAQNSINEDEIALVIGWPRVLGAVVTSGAALYEPGRPHKTDAADRTCFTLGEPGGMITRRLLKMTEVLGAVGPTKTTTNLWGERWSKLATNCMSNAVAGLTGLNSAELRQNSEILTLWIRIAAELIRVAEALGVSVEPIGGVPAYLFLEALEDGEKKKQLESIVLEHGKQIGTGRPSLAQDLVKGRRTEVEYLNGYVLRKGVEIGVPTPINKTIVELTRQVELGGLEPALSNLKYIDY